MVPEYSKRVWKTSQGSTDSMTNTQSWEGLQTCSFIGKLVRELILGAPFAAFSCAIIVAHALLIGVETDYEATYGETTRGFLFCSMAFDSWYVLELCLMVWASRRDFIVGPDRWWNYFDFIMAVSSLIELCMLVNQVLTDVSTISTPRTLRLIRMLRMVRIIRVGRVLRHFRELYKMVFSIASAGRTFIWAVLLLTIILYSFAVPITQGVTELMESPDGPPADQDVLERAFGSMLKSCSSLLKSISGGENWGVMFDAIHNSMEWPYPMLFIFYVTFSILCVLNVLTSIFVESAMQTAQHYREMAVMDKHAELDSVNAHLNSLFSEIDVDNSGTMTLEELRNFMKDDHCSTYFAALGLSPSDVHLLFKIMDVNKSGEVDTEEFLGCCKSLKGPANSFDIHCIIFEQTQMMKQWRSFMEFMETTVDDLSSELADVKRVMNQTRSPMSAVA